MSVDNTTVPHIDPRTLLQQLGIPHPTRIDLVKEGWGDTSMWRVEHDGRVSALRVYPEWQRDDRDREIAILRHVDHVPLPRVEATGEPEGLPSMLLSWCSGTTLMDTMWADTSRAWLLGVDFGHAQAAVHRNRASAALRDEVSGDWIAWGIGHDDPLERRLRGLISIEETVIHLDYHPLNVMVSEEQITCVIDWTNAHVGDPRADVARTYSILRWLPFPFVDETRRNRVIRTVFRRGWLRGYQESAGLLNEMAPFLAWAAATLRRDMATKVGRPGFWLTTVEFDRLEQVERRWRALVGARI